MLQMLDIAIGFATVMLAVSLIVMSITQALTSLLALRGAKLRLGIEELIRHAAPALTSTIEARQLTLATISREIVAHPLISDSAVTRSGWWGWASAIKKEELIPVLKAVLQKYKITDWDGKEAVILERWFDSFMNRVSQWFVMNTRWITVALAIVVAFAIHLDAAELYKKIRDDADTRARLSAMTATLLDQSPEAVERVEEAYRSTLKAFVTVNAASFKVTTVDDAVPLGTRQDVADWIGANTASADAIAGLVKSYNDALDTALKQTLDKSIDRAKTLSAGLAAAGIGTFPGAGGKWSLPAWSKVPGIVVSILFLSLGAPFWFNVLKNMTSLRSVLARKEDPEAAPEEVNSSAAHRRLPELSADATGAT